MPQAVRPADHARDFGDGFLLHDRAVAPAIVGVVVRVEPEGQCVGQPRDRVRRLLHVPDVERMMVGRVLLKPAGRGE